MSDGDIKLAYEEYAKDKPFPLNLEYETFRAGANWALTKNIENIAKGMSGDEIDDLVCKLLMIRKWNVKLEKCLITRT